MSLGGSTQRVEPRHGTFIAGLRASSRTGQGRWIGSRVRAARVRRSIHPKARCGCLLTVERRLRRGDGSRLLSDLTP